MAKKQWPNRLAALRERSRLTQQEIAKLLDLDVTTVCKHESGARSLSQQVVAKYAQVYKVQTLEIFLNPDEVLEEELEDEDSEDNLLNT